MKRKYVLLCSFVLVAVFLFAAQVAIAGLPPGQILPNTPNGCWEGGYQGSPYQCWVSSEHTYDYCKAWAYFHCSLMEDIGSVQDFYGPDYCVESCPGLP